MKKIEIIIRPSVFDKVREALSSLGVNGMNYQEIKGFGRQHGHVEVYRGTTINVDFLPKVRFEVVTKDDSVERIIQAVLDAARTGRVGDGKIFISDVQDAIRIRHTPKTQSPFVYGSKKGPLRAKEYTYELS